MRQTCKISEVPPLYPKKFSIAIKNSVNYQDQHSLDSICGESSASHHKKWSNLIISIIIKRKLNSNWKNTRNSSPIFLMIS